LSIETDRSLLIYAQVYSYSTGRLGLIDSYICPAPLKTLIIITIILAKKTP